MLKVAANLESVLPFQGLHEQLRQHLQGGDDTMVPPMSDLVSRIKGFPALEEGGHG
jgi:hypothetical protein